MGIFLILWVVLARMKSRLLPSHACSRCGSAASRRYDAEEVPPDMCSACFHTFVSATSRIEAGMKLRKERQARFYRRARSRYLRLFTLLWPGAGHLYESANARGVAFALWFACTLAYAGLAFGPTPWPHLEGAVAGNLHIGVVALSLLILYPLAYRSATKLD
jgi:hypothetical protein